MSAFTKIAAFLKKQNVEFSLKRYGLDALNFMALGLFSSLIVGLILKNIGTWSNLPWLVQIGQQAQTMMGAAIGVGVAFALKAPPLVLLTSVITGTAGASLGGPVGCFIAAALGAEAGKLISKTTPIDIVITPAVTLIVGLAIAQSVGAPIALLMEKLGSFIMWGVELHPFTMSILVAVSMGIILTLPISSAALAISLSLSGLAAGAATLGCCTQMVGFAVISYRENGIGGLLSQGLGTSMLQMPNIIKNPKIWIPPTLASAILAPLATLGFQMKNIPAGAGMGTSGLVGPISTLNAMGNTPQVWFAIALLYFFLPAVLSLFIAYFCRRFGWINAGDLKLHV